MLDFNIDTPSDDELVEKFKINREKANKPATRNQRKRARRSTQQNYRQLQPDAKTYYP